MEIQEKFTYQLLKYLEILDPGRTWTKEKLVKNLQGIMIKKGYDSDFTMLNILGQDMEDEDVFAL